MPEKEFIDIAVNKKAYHDYEIFETMEAGIELRGTEIKSIRGNRANLKDSFVLIRQGSAWVHNMHISPYGFGNIFNHDPTRPRRLLLHKKQIVRLESQSAQKGYTVIPLKIYIKGKFAKVQIGLAKGKKVYDKREDIKDKDLQRDMEREIKNIL